MVHKNCKAFLKTYRKVVKAKPEEKIDKRYHSWSGWLGLMINTMMDVAAIMLN